MHFLIKSCLGGIVLTAVSMLLPSKAAGCEPGGILETNYPYPQFAAAPTTDPLVNAWLVCPIGGQELKLATYFPGNYHRPGGEADLTLRGTSGPIHYEFGYLYYTLDSSGDGYADVGSSFFFGSVVDVVRFQGASDTTSLGLARPFTFVGVDFTPGVWLVIPDRGQELWSPYVQGDIPTPWEHVRLRLTESRNGDEALTTVGLVFGKE